MKKRNRTRTLSDRRIASEFATLEGLANRLVLCLREQLSILLDKRGITLGVPMESRVKSLESVKEKVKRKANRISNISDIHDLVGIRIIVLFLKDLSELDHVIRSEMDLVEVEHTGDRLEETQFGYRSNHYSVRLPKKWLEIPSYSDLGDLIAEIQVRTLAQHIWAAASHKLQYKREDSVPPPLRRTIHRVSALLETVDLEFERILNQRDEYVEKVAEDPVDKEQLNVDLIANILEDGWPAENIETDDDYDQLLLDLRSLGITTSDRLFNIIEKHRDEVLEHDGLYSLKMGAEGYPEGKEGRFKSGVYFTHCGLTRQALRYEFGSKINEVMP